MSLFAKLQFLNSAKCPRCKQGKLYKGMLEINANCQCCGLAVGSHDAGDAPMFFGICVVGTVVTVAATLVEVKYQPDYWIHAAIWPALIIIGSIFCIRIFKTWFIKMQFQANLFKEENH